MERLLDVGAAVAAARAAVARAVIEDACPFAAAEARVKAELGLDPGDPVTRLAYWQSRHPGSPMGDDRYRWEVSHRRCRPAAHAGEREEWPLWRPDLDADVDKLELRLSLPVSIAETCAYLAELRTDPRAGEAARALLAEALPLFRRDLAFYIQCSHPWADTFALFCVVRRPGAVAHLRPITLAIARSYAALAEDGALRGLRFPFHEQPIPSASAHLAHGLLALGGDIALLARLVAFVRGSMTADGAFGDVPDAGHAARSKFPPHDLLTTLACADLLASLDPSFDPRPSLEWMLARQGEDGLFRVMGPESVWLTGEVLGFARAAAQPFAMRFRWPNADPANLDRKTRLPFYAYFDDLARLFAELPGLAAAPAELAFVDLAGFRAFNNAFGQDMGDAVLRAFAEEIAQVAGTAAVRDGGDEFLLVGAPSRAGLRADLDAFRTAWPARFRERFGTEAPPVAPRILVGHTRGARLRECREALGRGIGELKTAAKGMGEEGVLAEVAV